MTANRKRLLALLLTIAISAPQVFQDAHAEKADRRKPAVIDAGEYSGDNKVGTLNLRKNVTITQGTLKIVGETGDVKGEIGVYTASLKGNPVCFRQKKDGSDVVLRGQAARVEYDQKLEKVEFFGSVILHDGPNEMRGDYALYFMATEKFEVKEKPNTQVRVVMVPKEKDELDDLAKDSTPAVKPKLKTAKEIELGRYEPLTSKCIKEAL